MNRHGYCQYKIIALRKTDEQTIAECVEHLLPYLEKEAGWADVEKTPKRYESALRELLGFQRISEAKVLTTFEADERFSGLENLSLALFVNGYCIAVSQMDRLIGLSKYARMLDTLIKSRQLVDTDNYTKLFTKLLEENSSKKSSVRFTISSSRVSDQLQKKIEAIEIMSVTVDSEQEKKRLADALIGYDMIAKELVFKEMTETSQTIEFQSVCAHHTFPFYGFIHVVFSGRRGLSNLQELVERYSKRLQTQEKLTLEIFNALKEQTVVDLRVVAKHDCMSKRGVKLHNAITETNVTNRGAIE